MVKGTFKILPPIDGSGVIVLRESYKTSYSFSIIIANDSRSCPSEGIRLVNFGTKNYMASIGTAFTDHYDLELLLQGPYRILVAQSRFGNGMGRIGDGDIHAAFVEFRAKESDKVSLFPS